MLCRPAMEATVRSRAAVCKICTLSNDCKKEGSADTADIPQSAERLAPGPGIGITRHGLGGDTGVFIGVLIFAFFLDFIDGPIARRWHQVSKPGPIIDSYADFSVYTAFLTGAW